MAKILQFKTKADIDETDCYHLIAEPIIERDPINGEAKAKAIIELSKKYHNMNTIVINVAIPINLNEENEKIVEELIQSTCKELSVKYENVITELLKEAFRLKCQIIDLENN